MKQVKSFQTSDGTLFPNRLNALYHEQKIDLRGVLQEHTKNALISTTDVAAILAANSEKVSAILHRYKVSINRARGESNKVKVIS